MNTTYKEQKMIEHIVKFDLLKTAIKYDVPLPETSEKLNWQKETHFVWGKLFSGEIKLYQKIPTNKIGQYGRIYKYKVVDGAGKKHLKEDFIGFVAAPQMHQIAPLLPKQIYVGGNRIILEVNYYKQWVGYDLINNFCLSDLHKLIKNNHYAQAYAKLYLSLREKGLLETKN